jgi:MOSC domain-containing protein
MSALTAIYVYPIKSCRGIAVETARVEPRGLAHDRRYMLVDANGRFITQRQHPRMALIEVAFEDDGYAVRAPGMRPLHLPSALNAAGECKVEIWRDTVEASLADTDTNLWFSEYMGFACGLAHLADHQHRPVTHASAAFDDEVSFADGAPLLLISEASLAGLNQRLARPVTIGRFRPNVVVTAEAPHAEDDWASISIGQARFDVAWSCSRCTLPTIDPMTGESDAEGEPLKTLRSYRRVGGAVMFGQNLLPRRLGTIRVGDAVGVENKEPSHEERNAGQPSA